jgi:hypothetical protein
MKFNGFEERIMVKVAGPLAVPSVINATLLRLQQKAHLQMQLLLFLG